MTAITTRPVAAAAAPTDSLLRFAMRLDATLSALLGLLVVATAEPLARLSGLSPTSEWIIGASLVGISVAVYAMASLRNVRLTGIALAAGNIGFTALLVATVLFGWLPLTPFGATATFATALYTLVIASLQYLGVRRLA